MAQIVQLTETPMDLVADSIFTQNETYRIQANPRNTADVVVWDTANPPGGPSGYNLTPGSDVVVEITNTVFYAWAFTEKPASRFAEIVIFAATE